MTASAAIPLRWAVLTTLSAAVLSYTLPDSIAATGVGLAFLGATYLAALQGGDSEQTAHFGLSLGGLLEPVPLSVPRMLRDSAQALLWAGGLALAIFPVFSLGFSAWWHPTRPFVWHWPRGLAEEALGQIVGVALPEEAFFRGYLQTALDDAWPARLHVLGAKLGPSLLVTSALFAVGHYLTNPHPSRLAVFFPSLLFGWLRTRTRGIGASLAFHAACNLFASFLGQSYGLW